MKKTKLEENEMFAFVVCINIGKLVDETAAKMGCQSEEELIDAIEKHSMSFPKVIAQVSGKYKAIGSQFDDENQYIFFPDTEILKVKSFIDELSNYSIEAKLADRKAIIDKRFLEDDGIYKGIKTTLPKLYLEKEILLLMEKYCHEYHIEQVKALVMFVGDLGGRELYIGVGGGDAVLIGGLKNGVMRASRKPSREYKKVIGDIERDIIQWRFNHMGTRKEVDA